MSVCMYVYKEWTKGHSVIALRASRSIVVPVKLEFFINPTFRMKLRTYLMGGAITVTWIQM
jgi:hypothetical protein